MARTEDRFGHGINSFGKKQVGAQACLAWTRTLDGGLLSSLSSGRMGRGVKLPPQLGQTPCKEPSTQSAQKVHSKVQMRALSDAGGKSQSQRSQLGRNSSMEKFLFGLL